METLEIHATPREVTGKKVKILRNEGWAPGVIYGSGIDSTALKFDSHDLTRAVSQAGSSTLINVIVEGAEAPYTAIVRDVQYHPIKRDIIHVDLQVLNMQEIVRVPVSLILVGESPAVIEEGGVLIQQLNEVEIECLPGDLVPSIEVDISTIVELGQSISLADITPPPGITFLTPNTEMIVQVTVIEEEEEEEELELEALLEPGEVEVITEAREEGEEEEEEEV